MAFKLKTRETLPDGIIRILTEQIDKSIDALSGDPSEREKGIHDARKSFKKIRAVLRLVRFELGELYSSENQRFRDLGRKLSLVRDTQALIETSELLQDMTGERLGAQTFAALRAGLVRYRETVLDEQLDLEQRVAEVLEDLRIVRQNVENWPITTDSFSTIGPGFKKVYRRGRRAYAHAYAYPNAEHFHGWRKRVKYHWHHIRLLQNVWPDMLDSYQASLKNLSNLLGDDHDLVVLHQLLRDKPDLFGDTVDLQQISNIIEERQALLRTQAQTLGQRIYVAKPGQFTRSMEQYYEAWQTEIRRENEPAEAVAG